MSKIDYSKLDWKNISDNPEVIELIKKKLSVEREIKRLDDKALMLLELQLLQII